MFSSIHRGHSILSMSGVHKSFGSQQCVEEMIWSHHDYYHDVTKQHTAEGHQKKTNKRFLNVKIMEHKRKKAERWYYIISADIRLRMTRGSYVVTLVECRMIESHPVRCSQCSLHFEISVIILWSYICSTPPSSILLPCLPASFPLCVTLPAANTW